MKIRIKGNSLRYRLTRSDISALKLSGFLEERTSFPAHHLVYAIIRTEDPSLSSEFTGHQIILYMPGHMIMALAETDEVGFAENSGIVSLLVEKDFYCLVYNI
jgi:hypothetical protein